MRLNRFLASAGLGSRRAVEEIILSGRVRINGQPVTNLATQVLPTDAVKVGSRLVHAQAPIYAVLHKPIGYVSTMDDELDRQHLGDLLPRDWPQVHHVGRLDRDSEGLLLVTNDGELTQHLTHPSHEVEKEYEVLLDRPFDPQHRAKMLRGFRIQPGFAKCERFETLHPTHLRIVLRQGLNRQIRLMLYDVGKYEVKRLVRVRLGGVTLADLPLGKWRFLSQKEVQSLRTSALPAPKVGGSSRSRHVNKTPKAPSKKPR